ncbi:MAG TPA: methylated-DNA--[protein]-cysteine S-methyltransferase [Thermoplasmata archaeon]|jgi:methylated-DNA-[protein]-cysteine S-methyltransferase|nr:methylated-DNA--[protein]-cysteine S-methyltransferase [Thermoplasmata archaeon]
MAASERIQAPFGGVVIEAEGRVVRAVSLQRTTAKDDARSGLAADLRRYFAGERVEFDDYDVDWSPYTTFERSVLEATRRIPYGETRTYGQIAKAIGKPDSARAVGQALGKNHTCIVVPCHRVVAANGGLGGFTGGIHWKINLLELEGSRREGKG